MTSYISKHLPLITARIEFETAMPRPLPTITARIEFDDARIRSSNDAEVRGFIFRALLFASLPSSSACPMTIAVDLRLALMTQR